MHEIFFTSTYSVAIEKVESRFELIGNFILSPFPKIFPFLVRPTPCPSQFDNMINDFWWKCDRLNLPTLPYITSCLMSGDASTSIKRHFIAVLMRKLKVNLFLAKIKVCNVFLITWVKSLIWKCSISQKQVFLTFSYIYWLKN